MRSSVKRSLLKFLGLGVLGGCASRARSQGRSVSTVLFNYTGRYIGDVTVDKTWAAGVDAYGGGGLRIEGLLAPSDPTRKVVLKVRWVVGSYYDIESNTYTRAPQQEPQQADVPVAYPYPENPSYLVLHFYPDGHVEAELEADRPKRRIPPPFGYHR